MENRARIVIKNWLADKINEKLREFKWVLVRKCKEEDMLDPNCDYSIFPTCPIIKETDKAIFVEIEAATYDDDYKEFRTWIPKSAIVDRVNF